MIDAATPALQFLLTRRSRSYKTLTKPVPDREALSTILTAAARVPDHGALVPWRFIVIEQTAMDSIGRILRERGEAMKKSPSLLDRAVEVFTDASLIVAVVASPDQDAKIPAIEQTLSAGAVCLSLLNAALASGWGANWLTGFGAHDAAFREKALGLKPHEFIAGFVHIGTETTPPPDRPRPDLAASVTWLR
ncbi:MAG: nitroreductase [Rhodobacteraceae bacterium]|nr:nitroreductase [Paracoccaceae bacterium]